MNTIPFRVCSRHRLVAALVAALATLVPLAWAQEPQTEIPFDPEVRRGTLGNGLTYYVKGNREPRDRMQLSLAVRAGSVLEQEHERGLAHFIEHMAFNGTASFPGNEIISYLESIGSAFGPDVNAYTGFDETVYTLDLPADDPSVLATGFDILSEWAYAISFDPEELERERGVVREERRLGRGAKQRILDQQRPVLFGDSRYSKRLPIGLPEIIETASADDLRGFYERWYQPDLMAVVAVGDFDPGEIEAMIREHFAPPPEGAAAYPRATRPDPPTERPEFSLPLPPYEDLPHHIATDADMSSLARLEIYCKRPADGGHDLASYRRMLVDSLFVAKTQARLAEVGGQPGSTYRRGHVDREHLVNDTAALRIAVDVDKDEIGNWIVLASILLRERFTDHKLETEKGNLLRAMDSAVRERDQRTSAQLALEYLQHFLYGKMVPGVEAEYDLHRQLLPEITVAEVNQVAESCPALRDMIILVAGPEDMDRDAMRGQIDEGISKLNDLLNGSSPTAGTDNDQRSVGRVDLTFDQFAGIFVVPEPGTIDAEERIESIDARRWTLSNGVTVIAKQTDFRDDDVQLIATSPGGHSLVADADYISALDAVDVVERSGLAIKGHRFWPPEKLIKPYIDELFEGFSGQSSPEDLETLLQFMRLYATATPWARTDQSVYTFHYDNLLSQWSRDFEERQSQPDTALIEAYFSAVTQDHFRTAPRTFQEETSLEGVEAVYAERFGDLGDFTFIIVGAFDWDELRSLAATYLATLPAAGRDETWRDLGIDPPPGVVERIVYRGIEERSSTIIAFAGDMEWSLEAEMELQALGEMLQIRLRERLREELGGTYSIRVGASGSALPDPEFRVMVGFSSDPARADELFEEVLIGVDWARDGAEQSYLDKAKKILLSNREEQLRRNDFWLDQIRGAVERHEPFESIVDFDERLDALTLEQVTEAARRYLSRDRYVRVVRLPEESESDSQ